ncbi:hypothetical protein Cni_G19648 [Canna indica]|uniref:Uncharacterized protein n=1 Tax=Canna indica TaxID=4628 RepID=A0AAQ3QH44_9LILI|nr:hypothetical protein Cni_G19648 [Canna indica]
MEQEYTKEEISWSYIGLLITKTFSILLKRQYLPHHLPKEIMPRWLLLQRGYCRFWSLWEGFTNEGYPVQ